MKSRILLNLMLLVFLAGLVALVIIEPGKEKKQPVVTLTSLNPSDITSVTIEQPQQVNAVLKKSNGEWQLQQPLSIAANKPLLDKLLNIVKTKSHSSYALSEVDTNQLHLNNPSLILFLNDKKFVFGDTDALYGYRYVLVDNRVHLITDRFSYLIHKDYTALVSPSLLPANINITRLTLPQLTIKESDHGWNTIPEQKVSSADQIQKIIDEWRLAQAMKITRLSDNNTIEISKKLGSIEVASSNYKAYSFNLLSTDDEIILTRPDLGLRYHFEKQAGQRLLSLQEISGKPDNSN